MHKHSDANGLLSLLGPLTDCIELVKKLRVPITIYKLKIISFSIKNKPKSQLNNRTEEALAVILNLFPEIL